MPNYNAAAKEKNNQEEANFRNQFGVFPHAFKPTGILTEDGLDQAQYLTEDLLVACRVVPGKETANMRKYGFVTPVDEYIYTHDSLPKISQKWGVPECRLDAACADQKAGTLRKAHKASMPSVLAKVYDAESLQQARNDWVMQRCNDADTIIKAVHELLTLGREEVMSASGVVRDKKLNAGSLKLLAETYKAAAEIKSVALGQPTKLTAQFNHSTTTRTEVKETVVNVPIEAQDAQFNDFEIEPPTDLPLALPEANVVEGEIEYSL